jgi:hypothetical protein
VSDRQRDRGLQLLGYAYRGGDGKAFAGQFFTMWRRGLHVVPRTDPRWMVIGWFGALISCPFCREAVNEPTGNRLPTLQKRDAADQRGWPALR